MHRHSCLSLPGLEDIITSIVNMDSRTICPVVMVVDPMKIGYILYAFFFYRWACLYNFVVVVEEGLKLLYLAP